MIVVVLKVDKVRYIKAEIRRSIDVIFKKPECCFNNRACTCMLFIISDQIVLSLCIPVQADIPIVPRLACCHG